MGPLGLAFKYHPRDSASANAMKQTCVIVILEYIPDSNKTALKTSLKHLNILFLTLDFSKQNGVSAKFSKAIKSPKRHRRAKRFRGQKHR